MLALAAFAFAAMLLHARLLTPTGPAEAARGLVRDLGLSDLALFTEARYTRHPSQADLATPFQDHPLALDHFPSGSLVPPQRHPGRAVKLLGGDPEGAVR